MIDPQREKLVRKMISPWCTETKIRLEPAGCVTGGLQATEIPRGLPLRQAPGIFLAAEGAERKSSFPPRGVAAAAGQTGVLRDRGERGQGETPLFGVLFCTIVESTKRLPSFVPLKKHTPTGEGGSDGG